MSSVADSQLPPPKSWDAFEELCADLFEREWQYPQTERYGRQGQRQHGVDIFGLRNGTDNAGVQCKGKSRWPAKNLTKKEIDKEIIKAQKFTPELRELIFATTSDNDVKIQDYVHKINEDNLIGFKVYIYWWPEITRRLNRYDDLIKKHFGFTQIGSIEKKIEALAEQRSFSFPKETSEIIDREIQVELEKLRTGRFFGGFDRIEAANSLADRLLEGDLHPGSSSAKALALCWCARSLAFDQTQQASILLDAAKKFRCHREIVEIVDAILLAATGERELALANLGEIDSPTARSAAFFVFSNNRESEESLNWITEVRYTISDFDPDGKFLLLSKYLTAGKIQAALDSTKEIEEDEYIFSPVLHYTSAMAHLLQAVPDEFRSTVFEQIPFEVESFPLSSTSEMLEHIRTARFHFQKCAAAAAKLELVTTANISEDYALWLGLRDPSTSEASLKELRDSMSDRRKSLRRLNFAIRFGLAIDVDEVAKEIDRQTALTAGTSTDAALARLALAFTLPSESAVAEYLARHREQLITHLLPTSILRLEVEMLCRSGQIPLAEARIKEFGADNIDKAIGVPLLRMISEAKGDDPISLRIEEYEKAPTITALTNLTNILEDQKRWESLKLYASILFEEVPAASTARKLALAMNALGERSEIQSLLNAHPEFIEQSEFLKSLWCTCLYSAGDVETASSVLSELRMHRDQEYYRELAVDIAITSGHWEKLQIHIEEEWSDRSQRTAAELVKTAHLARNVHSTRSRDLARYVATNFPDDPAVLLAAYEVAVNGGWEESDEVSNWLKSAIELSDENGPVRQMSLRDLVDSAPEWNKREQETWLALKKGEVPIFGAAAALNRSLCDLFLVPAIANCLELDPRKRSPIFAYSGTISRNLPPASKIALDATSLITLSVLGVTDYLCECFEEIFIPHSTLRWLFEEKQRIQFHQPSRIHKAKELRALLQEGKLERFVPSVKSNIALSAEVGIELSSLISEAKVDAEESSGQRVVIRSGPVHKLDSLMKEPADLSNYADLLCSCSTLVEKLWQKGVLTTAQHEKALIYLKRNEETWPNEPVISDGATVYLDSLTVNYLQHVGALSKIKDAGLTAVVSSYENEQLSALLRYEEVIQKAELEILKLREFLEHGIATKKIRLGPLPNVDREELDRFRTHPTVSILDVAALSDVAVVDDRFLNQHQNIDLNGKL